MRINPGKLRDLAYRRGLTQSQIAESIGMNRITINQIFNGKSCREETAVKLAEALSVPLEELQAITE